MKRIFVLALVAISFASCQNAAKTNGATGTGIESAAVAGATGDTAVPEGEAAVMDFEKGNYDFGKITQGEKVSYSYKFKNSGKSPLIISNATATCGCTIPETPKEPILPGAEGVIKVVFNSAGKMGMQDKVITVTSNANPNVNTVHLVGEVLEKK